jgi:hypothetical protein
MRKIYILLIAFFGLTPTIDAQTTIIPDIFFEQALINLGIDDVLNGSVITANISNITNLNLSIYGEITDLTGIEYFTSLQILLCYSQGLTTLNLNSNLMLTELDCSNNQLASLDLSANTELTKLNCKSNLIANLDLSSNKVLIDVQCYDNQITSMNLSGLVNLVTLTARWNGLSDLDISTNTELNFLNVQNNLLNCIQVNETQLQGLNSGHWSYSGYYADNGASYALNCSGLSVKDFDETQYELYPNPTSNILNIQGTTTNLSIVIYNVLGKEVISRNSTNQIDFSPLKKGIYFVKISDGVKTSMKKVVKN